MPKVRTKRWTVYILRCADKTLYTGITTDLANRIGRHNDGTGAKYTRSRRPVVLVWKRTVASESAARKREVAVKNMTRQEKLRMIDRKHISDALGRGSSMKILPFDCAQGRLCSASLRMTSV
jgi:putative endonuclease